MEDNPARRWTGKHSSESHRLGSFPQQLADWRNVVQVTIDMVPDVALVEVFDFYMAEALARFPLRNSREAWITLVHVCRKWRDIVFGSPRRLNLRLYFPARRSVRAMLDTWPPLLIDVWGFEFGIRGMDSIIEALEHDDRIRQIELFDSSSSHMEKALTAMRKPFPVLIGLTLAFFDRVDLGVPVTWPIVPHSFLSVSTPRLQSLQLRSIPVPLPTLRELLSSATGLVKIRIWRIPNSWYISSEEMVACLSVLTRLEEFELGFRQSHINWGSRRLPPSTRIVLPALISLQFKGAYEYMEDLMAGIDAPQLNSLKLFLFDKPVLNAPQLTQFICRTPRFTALGQLHVLFDRRGTFILLPWTLRRGLQFGVLPSSPNLLSVLVELCPASFLRSLVPVMKHLYVLNTSSALLCSFESIENNQWLELLHPFTTVKDLYLSQKLAPHIVPALCESVGEGMTEVLPALQNLFLEKLPSMGPVEEGIGQFVAARQLSGHQVAVSYWDGERHPGLEDEDHLVI